MSYYIYKICCDDCPDFVYVGSTKAFRKRKNQHKTDCNNKNNKLYTTIRENGGWENWRMVLIEDCGEITFTQARIKEEENRMKLNANLNMRKCQVNEKKEAKKEYNKRYVESHKEKNKEYSKQYRENNKEEIKEKQGKKITCECGRTFRFDGKAEHERSLIHKKFINEFNI